MAALKFPRKSQKLGGLLQIRPLSSTSIQAHTCVSLLMSFIREAIRAAARRHLERG
jgi:hypothetical protein